MAERGLWLADSRRLRTKSRIDQSLRVFYHFIRSFHKTSKKTFLEKKMIISEILRNEAFQEQMRKAAENQKKQYDFDKDPFRVRSSRPEPTTNLYGEPTQYYSRTHKKSLQHRFFEKMGWLSSDPTVRMVSLQLKLNPNFRKKLE